MGEKVTTDPMASRRVSLFLIFYLLVTLLISPSNSLPFISYFLSTFYLASSPTNLVFTSILCRHPCFGNYMEKTRGGYTFKTKRQSVRHEELEVIPEPREKRRLSRNLQKIAADLGALSMPIKRRSSNGAPIRTVGWRDPGFIHASFLKELWPNSVYIYKLGHRLPNGTYIWSQIYQFKSSPYPGQNSLQRVVIFGDMGKDEIDGSNEYNNFQRGSLNTTKQLIQDLKDIDIVQDNII